MDDLNETTDISAELDNLYGAEGTAERAKFDEDAWNFYTVYTIYPFPLVETG